MELVYLWVDGINNISGQGFNFSSKYQCSNDDYKLTICDKSKLKYEDNFYIYNLFSDNLYINAIVGENGSGKSTILDYLSDTDNFGASFYIYEEDDNLYICGDKYGLVTSCPELELAKRNVSIEKIDINNKNSDEQNYGFSDDLNVKITKVLSKKNDVLKYFDNRFIFDKLLIEVKRNNLISEDLLENNKFSKLLKNLHKTILILIKSNIKKPMHPDKFTKHKEDYKFSTNDISLDIKISFLIHYLSYLYDIIINDLINTKAKEELLLTSENYFDDLSFENMFKIIRAFEIKVEKLNIHGRRVFHSIEAYENLIDNFSKFNKKEFFRRNEYSYDLSKQFDIIKEVESINYIIEKCEICYSQLSEFKCLELNFYSYDGHVILSELSTGEQNLISKYFTIIYQILFSNLDILLIDEPDTYLHPKWAKYFLNNLINIITKDEELKEKKLHLIITTHSPFLLSDLPKENVIFLKNGKQEKAFEHKQTFGANIHTLLSDSFFMSDGLMGEFAKGKIEEIKKFYDDYKDLKKEDESFQIRKTEYNLKIDKFRHIQSIIGEPFLQTIIKNYLDELEIFFNGKNKFLDKEIERLQALKDK